MNVDVIDKSLKARIEIFKMYIVLIIGLITGISGLFFKESNKLISVLLIVAFVMLILTSFLTVRS